MKARSVTAVLVCMFVASACFAQGKASVLLVKIQDHARSTSYEVMTPEEYKTLQKTVADEAKYFKRALEFAEKAWQQDETLKEERFPSTATSPRKVLAIGQPYADRSKAADKMISYTDKERERDSEEQAALDKVYSQMRKNEGLDKKGKCRAQIEDEKKAALYKAAREIVIDNLAALIASGGKMTQPKAASAPSAGGEGEDD